jgi:hypothetical protein
MNELVPGNFSPDIFGIFWEIESNYNSDIRF